MDPGGPHARQEQPPNHRAVCSHTVVMKADCSERQVGNAGALETVHGDKSPPLVLGF
jgi:hypothetical protein